MKRTLLLLVLSVGTFALAQANTMTTLAAAELSSIVLADSATGNMPWRGAAVEDSTTCPWPCTTKTFSIAVYPNPSSDFVSISVKDGQADFSVEVMDIRGLRMAVKATRPRTNLVRFPVQGWNEGMYIIQVRSAEGVVTKTLKVE